MDGDHDGSSLQEEQLMNGDMDVPVKGGGDCTSSASQDTESTGADANNKCDKKAFSDTMVNHSEEDEEEGGDGGGGRKKTNGLVNGEGEGDDASGSEGDVDGSKGDLDRSKGDLDKSKGDLDSSKSDVDGLEDDMDTSESSEVKNSKAAKEKESSKGKTSEKDTCLEGSKSEKDKSSDGNKSKKDQCSEKNKSEKDSCDEKVDSEQGDVSMETDCGADDSGDKVAKNSKDSHESSLGEIDEPVAKKDKSETKSEKNTKSKDSKNESPKSDTTTANSRKRKSFEEKTIISSDEEVHEEIVIQKKPKLQQKSGKPLIVFPASIAPATKVTYSVGQTMSIGIIPNQSGTVRMVIPSLQNKLMSPPGTPVLISPGQTSLFTTQGLSLGTAVLYPPIQAGSLATFAQGKQNFKNRGPLMTKITANTTVTPSNAPRQVLEMKTPSDSQDMIEMVKWELRQGVYNRPKNFRIKPDSELGPMARLMRDFGQDLVKESVYSDLVRIQSRRGNQGKLSVKEQKDFEKLKSVHSELKEKVGPVMISLKKKCKCGFKTESENVMHWHKQFPHVDEYDLKCAYCDFDTRTNSVFVFHMEVEHGTTARFLGKPPFWECSLCPYETNLKNKLTQHRMRCGKSFKMNLNLHPSWLPGPETNFCLEKTFYKNPVLMNMVKQQARTTAMPIMPKQPNIGSRFASPSTQPNRNPHLLASLNKKVQNVQNRGTGRMAYPNVNIFQKSGSVMSYNVRPNTASNTVTNKINHLISMNNRVLDHKAVPQVKSNSGFEVCEICGGYVKDRTALRIHFFYAHRIDMPHGVFDRVHPPLYCATCFARFWTAQGLQKHLDVHKEDASGGVAGKCIVCLHRVPNILMHMKIVHNKAFVSFLRDCKCIFCGVKFHSKELVEAHMATVHGVVVKSGAQPSSSSQGKKQTGKPQKGRKDNLVKGSVCVLCNLNFGRNVDLTRHCMRVHHTCMKCGMVVADKESLLRHTCLESPSGLRNCELCGEKGFHPAYHVKHIRDKHLRKMSVRVKRLSKQTIAKYARSPASSTQQMQSSDNPIELSESDSDDEPYSKRMKVDTRFDKNPPRTVPPGSRRRGYFKRPSKESDIVLLIDDDSDEDVSKSDDKSKKKGDDNKEKNDDAKEKGDDMKEKSEDVKLGKDKSEKVKESGKAKAEGDAESGTASTSDVKDDENSKDSDKADDSAEKDTVKHVKDGVKKDIDKANADSGNNKKDDSAGDKDDDVGGDKNSSDKE